MYDYEWADLIDKQDKLKMLIDPQSMYATNAAWALGRSMDDAIIDAFYADAATGKAGTGTAEFTPANIIAESAAGMSLAKLLEAKELLDAADCDPNEERYVIVTAGQVTDLLNTTEVKDADYNSVRALVAGKLETFLGFRFIRTQRLDLSGTSRRCMAYVKSGMLLALADEVQTRIDERSDKSYATQVYAKMGIGSTRMEEAKCVAILCKE